MPSDKECDRRVAIAVCKKDLRLAAKLILDSRVHLARRAGLSMSDQEWLASAEEHLIDIVDSLRE